MGGEELKRLRITFNEIVDNFPLTNIIIITFTVSLKHQPKLLIYYGEFAFLLVANYYFNYCF